MPELSTTGWLLVLGALALIGYSKTAVAGVGTVAVAVFAIVLPARQSTGALLPLLLCGDLVAVAAYRRHADWSQLWRLFPWVAAGIVAGAVLVGHVDDRQMRRTIGLVLILVLGVAVWDRRREGRAGLPHSRAVVIGAGALAGFTTMVANAGGPVLTLYLLAAGLPMLEFLGTSAWFFFVLNVFKVPFSVGLGLITPASLGFDLLAAPAIVAGALLGRATIRYIDQALFERLALGLTLLAAVRLLV